MLGLDDVRRQVGVDPAEAVAERFVLVDPAGLAYVRSTRRGAGGASAALYDWLGWSAAERFPRDVSNTALAKLAQALLLKSHDREVHQHGKPDQLEQPSPGSLPDLLARLPNACAAQHSLGDTRHPEHEIWEQVRHVGTLVLVPAL